MTSSHDLPPDPGREAGFPTVVQLRRSLVLDCIARSFCLPAHAVFEMHWADGTYFADNFQGEHWAVSFSDAGAVAVFYSSESPRNPFPADSLPYDQSWYFRGIPCCLEPALQRALGEMYDLDYGCGNPAGAVITAAMWADGERFTAVEPWEDMYDDGLWVLPDCLLPPEEALREWWERMGFPDSLMGTVWSLYQRRLAATASVIPVEPWEWQAFVNHAGGHPARAAAAEELLVPVGITLAPFLDHKPARSAPRGRRPIVLDRCSLHAGGDLPTDVPPENGGTLIGMFLAWMIRNGLEAEMHRRDAANKLRQVRERTMTGREFLFRVCDGKFWDADLCPEGLAFARWYYAQAGGTYGPYLDDYVEAVVGELPTVYHVADSWDNFDRLAPFIDARYAEWKQRHVEQTASRDVGGRPGTPG